MTTRALWHPGLGRVRPTGRWIVLSLIAAMAFALAFALPEDRAEAATEGAVGQGVLIAPAGYGEMWLGAYNPPNGGNDLAWCIQGRVYTSAGSTPTGSSFSQDGPLAYVMAKYASTDEMYTRAAIAYLVHQRHEIPGGLAGGDVTRAKALIADATPQAVKDRAAQLLAEGAADGGPYVPQAGSPTGNLTRRGEVKDIGIRSDAGMYIPGVPVTVTLEGDGEAVFDLNNNGVKDPGETNVWSGTTRDGVFSLAWVAVKTGTIRPKSVYGPGIPRYTLTKFDTAGNRQAVISYGNRINDYDPETVTVSGPPITVIADFQPEVSTTVASTFVGKGQPLIDRVTAAAAAGDTWVAVDGSYVPVTGVGTLYGPFDSQPTESATVPAGAPVVGTETLTFNGPGTLSSAGNLKVPSSGFYTWVWRITKSEQPAPYQQYVRGNFADRFGRVAETSIVPFQPQVTTEREVREVVAGERIVDKVTASAVAGDLWLKPRGSSTGAAVTFQGKLIGPLSVPTAEVANGPANAPVAATASLTFNGPGTQSTPPTTTVSAPGFYTWVWTMSKAQQPVGVQPYLVGDYSAAYMIEVETSTVRHKARVVTQTREFNVAQGGRAMDRIIVTGFPADHGDFDGVGGWAGDVDELTHTAYGPFENAPTANTDLSKAPVLNTVTTPARNGDYWIGSNGEFTPTEPGYYVFVTTFPGDDRVLPLATSPGDPMEMFFVPSPLEPEVPVWVTTQATESAAVGQPIRDVATVTGTVHPGDYLVFQAYGPFGPDDAPAEDADRIVWTSEQVPVPAPGEYPSGYTTVGTAGDVYWVATLYDRDGDVRVRGDFGAASEVTKVYTPDPIVVKTLASLMVSLGDPAYDTAYVSGPVPPESRLSWALYRQSGDEASEDDELVGTAPPVTIYHGGEYRSKGITVDQVGIHYWVHTLTAPDGTILDVGARGVPEETTYVVDVTSRAVTRVNPGAEATDTALLSGPTMPGSTIGFVVYQKVGDKAAESDPLIGTVPPVLVESAGAVTSTGVVLPEKGTYYWTEVLYAPDGTVIHTGERGLPNETTRAIFGSDLNSAGADLNGAAADTNGAILAVTGGAALEMWAVALLAVFVGIPLHTWAQKRRAQLRPAPAHRKEN